MNKEKELPKEVQEKELYNRMATIVSEFTSDDDKILSCINVAQSHYEPIIDGLKEKYENMAKKYGETVDKLSAASTENVIKDATIAKIMGLLKETYLNHKRVSIIFHVKHAKKHLSEIENEFWEQFKKENNLPQ